MYVMNVEKWAYPMRKCRRGGNDKVIAYLDVIIQSTTCPVFHEAFSEKLDAIMMMYRTDSVDSLPQTADN